MKLVDDDFNNVEVHVEGESVTNTNDQVEGGGESFGIPINPIDE